MGYKPANLEEQLQYNRAIEATIWGVPAVSMVAIRHSLKRDLDANFGDIVYFSKVLEARHELLTANNQTPYVMTVLDLRNGPMVLEVPAATKKVAFFGSAIDSWEVPLADIGPAGEDAGKGGNSFCLQATLQQLLKVILSCHRLSIHTYCSSSYSNWRRHDRRCRGI